MRAGRATIEAMQRVIEATTTIGAVLPRVSEILVDEPATVLGDGGAIEGRRSRSFLVDVAVELGAGVSLHQTVELRLGAPRPVDGGVALPVAWHASEHERLFPIFDGELEALEDRAGTLLRLRGTYTVPLGAVGRFGDGIAGRRIARQSLTALTEQIAHRVDREVGRRLEAAPGPVARAPVTVQEDSRSEIYLG